MCVSKNVDGNDQETVRAIWTWSGVQLTVLQSLKVFNGQLYKMCKQLKISLAKQTINRESSLFFSKPFKNNFWS